MHSFGLEECNHYAEAEKVARKVIIYILLYALYTGKINIRPFRLRCQWKNSRLGEF